jgi:hypothetical protein
MLDEDGLTELPIALFAVSATDEVLAFAPEQDGQADAYTLVVAAESVEIRNSQTGAVLSAAARGTLGSISISGASDDDTFTIDFSAGNPLPAGGLDFDGADNTWSGGSIVLINGSVQTVSRTPLPTRQAA